MLVDIGIIRPWKKTGNHQCNTTGKTQPINEFDEHNVEKRHRRMRQACPIRNDVS